ncbi:MAG TPA: hypothetical protein VNC78_06120 [Actinomycetota bacterium]|nr:hypothetical protein [Actinomycetota bacterium]
MGSADEVINICVNEAFRYRGGLGEQMHRIDEARGAYRDASGDIVTKVMGWNRGEKARLKNETEYFFVCVRGIVRMAEAVERMAQKEGLTELESRVAKALGAFDGEAPHAVFLRDFLAHLDEYARGDGRYELPQPDHPMVVAPTEDDVLLYLSGIPLSVNRTFQAAMALSDVLRDISNDRHDSGRGSETKPSGET